MEDREAVEIYKEIAKTNAKLSVDVASKLDRVADNLKELNDNSVLHQKEIMQILKIVSSKYFKLIIYLVIALALVAVGEKAIPIMTSMF